MQLTRVRGVPGGAFCGPRPEARPLRVIRRHFLLKGYEHGVGGLSTVELLVRHPVQLLGREMHVLMDVLVLFGRRQAEVLHQQLQRLQLVGPPGLNTRLLREYVEIGVGNYGRGRELILRFSSSSAAGMSSCIFTGPGRRASH